MSAHADVSDEREAGAAATASADAVAARADADAGTADAGTAVAQPADARVAGGGAGFGPGAGRGPGGTGGGILALSLPYQAVAAVALAVVAIFACYHLAMVFLHVAPANTLTKRHGQAVDEWIYPEFEQNWKLFAPNPLQQNVSVEVRAEVVAPDGRSRTTGWIDLTAQDVEDIRGNVFPSHTQQNELRRAIDWYENAHDDDNRPKGMRGELSEAYMRRIAMLRLEGPQARVDLGGTVRRLQLRKVIRPVPAAHWSTEKYATDPSFHPLSWWTITDADRSRTETSR